MALTAHPLHPWLVHCKFHAALLGCSRVPPSYKYGAKSAVCWTEFTQHADTEPICAWQSTGGSSAPGQERLRDEHVRTWQLVLSVVCQKLRPHVSSHLCDTQVGFASQIDMSEQCLQMHSPYLLGPGLLQA